MAKRKKSKKSRKVKPQAKAKAKKDSEDKFLEKVVEANRLAESNVKDVPISDAKVAELIKKNGKVTTDLGVQLWVNGEMKLEVGNELYARANKVGLTDEQLLALGGIVGVETYLNRISPKTNPALRPQPGMPSKKVVEVPKKFVIKSTFKPHPPMRNRARFDEDNLQAELRRINRKYGRQAVKRTTQIVNYEPLPNKDLVTEFIIELKTKG